MTAKEKQLTQYFDVIINFDGACEPSNPGGGMGMGVLGRTSIEPIADIAATEMGSGNLLYKKHKGIPPDPANSNNVAEYRAFIHALHYAGQDQFRGKKILIMGDSQLVIRQMANFIAINRCNQKKRYRMKGGLYEQHYHTARELLEDFPGDKLHLWWIGRDYNEEADGLSKLALKEMGITPMDRSSWNRQRYYQQRRHR